MAKKGLFIVVEGLDGSGKATQVNLLLKYLEDKNIPTSTYDFPRYYDNFWGKMVGRMLAGEFGTRVHPYLRTMFYTLDQADASKSIEKDISEGKIVISNRYITSSMLFQTAQFPSLKKQREYQAWLDEAAFEQLKARTPDLVLALFVKPEVAREMNLKKEARKYLKGKKEDINEKNYRLQEKVAVVMQRLCKEQKNWVMVNCMDDNMIKSPEAISKDIQDILKPYLNI